MSEEVTLDDFSDEGDENVGDDNNNKGKRNHFSNIPQNWSVSAIDDIIADENNAFTDGARYSLSSAEIHDEGDARAILLEEVGEGYFKDSNPKFATEEKYEDITHRAIYPGEVVVAKMAEPVARACIVPDSYDKYLLGCADVVRIVPNSKIDDRFLMYCMNSHEVWRQAVSHLRGTGRSRINLENIAELKIPVPSIEEQRKIATVLYTVDRAIEKTEAIIDKREEIKHGLMQDIFQYGIDSDGELRLTKNDAYQETKYGPAPKEWEILPLEDIVVDDASITYGIVKPGDHYPGGVPVVKVKNITNGEIQTDNLLHTDPEIHQKYDRAELNEGDLLFTIRGTVGRMAFVPESLEGGNLTQDTARIRVEDAKPEFVRYYLETATPHNYFERHTKGQAVQGINLEDLQQVPVHLPSPEKQERIVEILDSHTKQIQNEREYLDQLQHLKRGLMQDLLSGTVRTADNNIEVPEEIEQYG